MSWWKSAWAASIKSVSPASITDGTIEIADTEVCAQLQARWPITVIESREALVHANVCLRNDNKNNDILPPISEELAQLLTISLEKALNSNKWRHVFASIEKLMEEIGPEELERGNAAHRPRTGRACRPHRCRQILPQIGPHPAHRTAYGEARKRFISNCEGDLRKRGLAIGTFAIVNIDLDRSIIEDMNLKVTLVCLAGTSARLILLRQGY